MNVSFTGILAVCCTVPRPLSAAGRRAGVLSASLLACLLSLPRHSPAQASLTGFATPTPRAEGKAGPRGFQGKGSQRPEPLQAGSTPLFSYRPHPDESGVFLVDMSDGSTLAVSEGYLASVVRSPQPPEMQAQSIRSYPSISDQMINKLMELNYPDPNTVSGEPLAERTLQGENGESYILAEDPEARGYVRVSKIGSDGKVLEEFTVSRPFVNTVLAKTTTSDALKIKELTRFPFRLPEDLRPKVNDMTTTEVRERVRELPAIRNQQIFKAAQLHEALVRRGGGVMESTTALTIGEDLAASAALRGILRGPEQDREEANSARNSSNRSRNEEVSPGEVEGRSASGGNTARRVIAGLVLVLGVGAAAWAATRRRQ